MSTTNASKRSGASVPPLAKSDALDMLRSAIGYVMQAGFEVGATTDAGRLVVVVHGAQLTPDRSGFVVTTPAE